MVAAPTIDFWYQRPGRDRECYVHRLVTDEPDLKVMLMERYDGRPIIIDGGLAAEEGSAMLWFVFPGAWHDIGRFHLADNTLTGWYTNLCTPVRIDGNTWSSTDLFLDHWMTPTGNHLWLDEDELAQAVERHLIDHDAQEHIRSERRAIQQQLDAGAWPPAIVQEMDLPTAKGLLRR